MTQLKVVLPVTLLFFSFTVFAHAEKPNVEAVPPPPPPAFILTAPPPPPRLKMIGKFHNKHSQKFLKTNPGENSIKPEPPPPPPSLLKEQ